MKPIIFSTPMVQAILDGRKTQTRRIIKPQPPQFVDYFEKRGDGFKAYMVPGEPCDYPLVKPKYQPGDILWVRETWATVSSGIIEYKATYIEPYTGSTEIDHIGKKITWQPSIHMPREAARIFLRVTNVRVERLQEISVQDAKDEGIKVHANGCADGLAYGCYNGDDCIKNICQQPIKHFQTLWDSINAKRGYGWDTNPWVWVVEFEHMSKGEALLKESEVEEE